MVPPVTHFFKPKTYLAQIETLLLTQFTTVPSANPVSTTLKYISPISHLLHFSLSYWILSLRVFKEPAIGLHTSRLTPYSLFTPLQLQWLGKAWVILLGSKPSHGFPQHSKYKPESLWPIGPGPPHYVHPPSLTIYTYTLLLSYLSWEILLLLKHATYAPQRSTWLVASSVRSRQMSLSARFLWASYIK